MAKFIFIYPIFMYFAVVTSDDYPEAKDVPPPALVLGYKPIRPFYAPTGVNYPTEIIRPQNRPTEIYIQPSYPANEIAPTPINFKPSVVVSEPAMELQPPFFNYPATIKPSDTNDFQLPSAVWPPSFQQPSIPTNPLDANYPSSMITTEQLPPIHVLDYKPIRPSYSPKPVTYPGEIIRPQTKTIQNDPDVSIDPSHATELSQDIQSTPVTPEPLQTIINPDDFLQPESSNIIDRFSSVHNASISTTQIPDSLFDPTKVTKSSTTIKQSSGTSLAHTSLPLVPSSLSTQKLADSPKTPPSSTTVKKIKPTKTSTRAKPTSTHTKLIDDTFLQNLFNESSLSNNGPMKLSWPVIDIFDYTPSTPDSTTTTGTDSPKNIEPSSVVNVASSTEINPSEIASATSDKFSTLVNNMF